MPIQTAMFYTFQPSVSVLTRGTWRQHIRDKKEVVTVICPGCGYSACLEGTHIVQQDGEVVPSLVCPECSFHERVVLVGWCGVDATVKMRPL